MKYLIIILFCAVSMSSVAQTRSAVGLGYFQSGQSGLQTELSLRVMLYKTFFLGASVSSDLEDITIMRLGVGTQVYQKDKFTFLMAARVAHEQFLINGNDKVFSYNIEIPLEINYDLSRNFHFYASIVPTHNTYDSNKVKKRWLSYSVGAGYSF